MQALRSASPVCSCSSQDFAPSSVRKNVACSERSFVALKSTSRVWSSFVPRYSHNVTVSRHPQIRASAMGETESSTGEPGWVMVNGLSGKMGLETAKAALEAGLQLVPYSFTGRMGPDQGPLSKIDVEGVEVEVYGFGQRELAMDLCKQVSRRAVVIDYTVPAAVIGNASLYCSAGVPFVMGTTGGDREKLMRIVNDSKICAVIAPQMGKQVVAFQAAMEIMAEQFPGAFSGYKLKVTESHQSTKLDTSGTAKAVISSFKKLGLNFDLDQITSVREEEGYKAMQVPEDYYNAHAFHTYRVSSPDDTVAFEFKHNVCGRKIYAQGTVDAVLFLMNKIQKQTDGELEGKVFNMIDVLREGNMR
ncbi:4-hydroxy-tetrahydrodipicolinate reductase [Marchantia polymorpha subsp. ruderalis]|uniref:4-hydroxy-tetrahydrodipicolinate reductase n=2 Tax=Marchantia polymorpha TaxID=3197 RepID=A0AAF6AQE8_MARPO|nr:hypothetical protein MARPO_0033s0134 [Marchantia polymorpha]BBM98668.1 hypothetical protein Mp_1g15270 [Marchantia polymorpha subsp. ruderalis]|eukprot:PTQ41740.1 hypothetical protein MARPO_0033s0134 [Marchantia polymorpha]